MILFFWRLFLSQMFASRKQDWHIEGGSQLRAPKPHENDKFFFKRGLWPNFLEDWGCFFFAPKPWNLGLQEFTCFNDLDRKQLYLAGPLDGCQVLLQNLVSALAFWRIFLLHKMAVIEDAWKYCTHLYLYFIYIYICEIDEVSLSRCLLWKKTRSCPSCSKQLTMVGGEWGRDWTSAADDSCMDSTEAGVAWMHWRTSNTEVDFQVSTSHNSKIMLVPSLPKSQNFRL